MNTYKYIRHILLLALLFSVAIATAQTHTIKGIVHELESSQRIPGVKVKNLRTAEETLTDREGQFHIEGQINDYLTLTQSGYEVDTAFIYQEGIQRIYLVRDEKAIVIDEIVVSRLTDSRLVYEIAKAKQQGQVSESSQHRGGLRLSPSRLFGKQGKLARQNLDLLLREQNDRRVDRLFSKQLIIGIVPLDDAELALFREQFRPTQEFMETASPEDIRAYILESYSKFKSNNK